MKYTEQRYGKDKICIIPPKFVLNTQKTKCLPKKPLYPQAKGYIQKNSYMKLFLLFPKNQIPSTFLQNTKNTLDFFLKYNKYP